MVKQHFVGERATCLLSDFLWTAELFPARGTAKDYPGRGSSTGFGVEIPVAMPGALSQFFHISNVGGTFGYQEKIPSGNELLERCGESFGNKVQAYLLPSSDAPFEDMAGVQFCRGIRSGGKFVIE